ncbi:MAG: transposase [Xanthomonadaceae bacterium]|nr:transposase [Xanthomonadaceae bacterium]
MNYDHYIGIDWSLKMMAVARMTKYLDKATVFEGPADVKGLKAYLSQLKGTKIMTIEEGTWSHWLYTELKGSVDRLIICDPTRNALLKEGAKTDKIDAEKLARLLRSGHLKEVYHELDEIVYLRQIVSAYEDLILNVIGYKNQKFAILRGYGCSKKEDLPDDSHELTNFIFNEKADVLELLEEKRKEYEDQFKLLTKKHPEIKLLQDVPGFGLINSVKILSRVVDAKRFETKGAFLSYCGLIKLEHSSGGKIYYRKNGRYCKMMKNVFKTAAMVSIISPKNQFGETYHYLMKVKKYPAYQARHAIARIIATTCFGILKSKKKYKRKEFEKNYSIED